MKTIKENPMCLFLIPPFVFILFFMVIPLMEVLIRSVFDESGFTLAYFQRFFATSLYMNVLKNTFTLSLIVSVLSLVLGYPIAYSITKASRKGKIVINTVVQILYWTSLLVKTYIWIIMLQQHGVINTILMGLGLIDQPIQLLHTYFGVVCGMTYIFLPYMIFSLTPIMQQIDTNLLTASENLGASRFYTFRKIFLPLSVPGIVSGFSIVFLNALGYYIVPALLGGQSNTMMSQLIQQAINVELNWNFAAAISVVLIIVTILIMLITQRLGRVKGESK